MSTDAAPPALAARQIGISFAGLRALDGVDLDLAPGEIVGVIGPNGAGKTTLFDCLSGFLRSEGRVWLNGRELTRMGPRRRAAAGLARSFQDARLFPTMTVLDTLRVACELELGGDGPLRVALRWPTSRRTEKRATALADELCSAVGLADHRNKLVRELSTGTRRLLDLACLLAGRPVVMLLDEPSAGIAQREAEALGPLLGRLRDTSGCALLVIEHDIPLVTSVADRLYALETGRVIAQGPPGDVVRHPEVVRAYLGDDPAVIARSGRAPG